MKADSQPSQGAAPAQVGRQHHKDKKRRHWERHAQNKPKRRSQQPLYDEKGRKAVESMLDDLLAHYVHGSKTHSKEKAEVYEHISKIIQSSRNELDKEPVTIAQTDPHHQGLSGHGTLIEYCASEESKLAVVGNEYGVNAVRCTESSLKVDEPGVEKSLTELVTEKPGLDRWAGNDFADKLEQQRDVSKKMLKRFCRVARAVARQGGRVTFEWPRHCAGWSLHDLLVLIQELDLRIVDFDGCQCGVIDKNGNPALKQWRLATSCPRLARLFSKLRCPHPQGFEHAVIEGSATKSTGFYPRLMCEQIVRALYPDLRAQRSPAMPVIPLSSEAQGHRENEPTETPAAALIIDDQDSGFAMPADSDADDGGDDAEPLVMRETRDERLKKEAVSLERMTLRDRKNPFCQQCMRGRMLKRYAHRRNDPEEMDIPYVRATAFGDIVEADTIFPSTESKGMRGEQAALLVRDRYSGVCLAYLQTARIEDANYEALKHFGGHALSGKTDTVFCSDSAHELTNAASRLCCVIEF